MDICTVCVYPSFKGIIGDKQSFLEISSEVPHLKIIKYLNYINVNKLLKRNLIYLYVFFPLELE